jgi:hypothetical protein
LLISSLVIILNLLGGGDMKKLLTIVVISSTLFATGTNSNDSNAITTLNKLLQKAQTPEDAPDWLKRTSIKLEVEKNYKPTYELETVQPIYQINDIDMFFWQFHTSYIDTINTYNLGIGYRNIVNNKVMLGINSFYDYQDDHNLQRYSIGVEAIGNYLEFRANRYMAISNRKEVEPNVFEQVLNGYDAEIGGLIPKTKLKIFASYTRWQADKAPNDLIQRAMRLEYPINKSILFDLKYTSDYRKRDNFDKNRISASITVNFGTRSKSSKNRVVSKSLQDRLLIPVKRENKIIVEKTISAKITISRGN